MCQKRHWQQTLYSSPLMSAFPLPLMITVRALWYNAFSTYGDPSKTEHVLGVVLGGALRANFSSPQLPPNVILTEKTTGI